MPAPEEERESFALMLPSERKVLNQSQAVRAVHFRSPWGRWACFGLVATTLVLPAAAGEIWPPRLDSWERVNIAPAAVPDKELYEEFGLEEAQSADYKGPQGQFSATAWRMSDPTGAMALFQALRPGASWKPASRPQAPAFAVTTAKGRLFVVGSYVIEASRTAPANLEKLVETLPGLRRGSMPVLLSYLPEGAVANSERYLLGPVALARFEPRIPAEAVRFEFSAEGYLGRYRLGGAETTVALFSYPTPGMARDQLPEFEKIPGALVKRSGPLVAVALGAPTPEEGAQLLTGIEYELGLTENYEKPLVLSVQDWMKILLGIIQGIGYLLVFCTFAGLLFGIGRAIKTRLWPGEYFTSLHLSDPVTTESPRE
jgi:hypothetical protein